VDENGNPAHSWRILLLPWLDQGPLYNAYRFDEPWNGPNNSKLAEKIPSVYRCPSFAKYQGRFDLETAQTKQLTNYVAVTGVDAIFSGARATTLRDIADGTSQTIAIAEARNHAVHWMQPDDVTATEFVIDVQAARHEHHANHLGGLHSLAADGSVHFISSQTDVKTIHGLITRNGKEPLREF
jgi:hypothetical protein